MSERNYDALKLNSQLCFPMYACSRELIRAYKPFLDDLGLTYTQYITMMVLWERNPMTVKELGSRLYLDSGTLTPLLKKLEEKGLVSRRRSLTDERNLMVSLTDEGEKLGERAAAVPEELVRGIGLTSEESAQLYGLLQRVLERTAADRD